MFILSQNQKALVNVRDQSIVLEATRNHKYALKTTRDECYLGLFEYEEEAKSALHDIYVCIAKGDEVYSVRKT